MNSLKQLAKVTAFALVALISKRHMRALKTATRLGCLGRIASLKRARF